MFFLLLVFVVLFLLYYYIGRYNENYWKKRGIILYPKNKVIGPFWDYLVRSRTFFDLFDKIYQKYPNEPAVGIGAFLKPSLFVKDPVNIQHVLSTDFKSFNHRGLEYNEGDHLADNVLFMYGDRWKLMRQKMSPLFTSAKLKKMYYIMDKSAQDFVDYLKKNPSKQTGNAYDTINKFCCAAIAAAVFGIGTSSTFDSPFLKMSRKAFKSTLKNDIKFVIGSISESLFRKLRLNLFREYENFFIGAIEQVIQKRQLENTDKHDFVDICVDLQKTGTMKDLDSGYEIDPTVEVLAAQGFFFFTAGVEPSANSIYGTLLELARHPEILQRVHDEIDATFERNNYQLSFEVVSQMEYVEKVLCEGLRIHPPVGILSRKCSESTVLPVGDIRVDKGTKIFIPVYSLHHDPKFYPDPEVFDPERFSDIKVGRNDKIYMPFGYGNRICLGARYAKLQVKAGLVHLLRHFTVKCRIGVGGIKYDKSTFQVKLLNVDLELIPRIRCND